MLKRVQHDRILVSNLRDKFSHLSCKTLNLGKDPFKADRFFYNGDDHGRNQDHHNRDCGHCRIDHQLNVAKQLDRQGSDPRSHQEYGHGKFIDGGDEGKDTGCHQAGSDQGQGHMPHDPWMVRAK